jgi:AcrR family transcriptional regulator
MEKRTRGRPRTFEAEVALDSAMHTFWQGGYAATTLDGLGSAMGLNKPSIYATFGNKEALYRQTLDHYMKKHGSRYLRALNSTGELRRDLAAHFSVFLDTVTGEHGPGCPISCTLPAESENSPAVKAKLAELLKAVDDATSKRLKSAKHQGQISKDADVRALAQIVVGTMLQFGVRARAGATRSELNRIAKSVVNLICSH